MTPAIAPTFADLAALEPRLQELYDRASEWLPIGHGRYCELVAWRQLKREMVLLVGWSARTREPLLRSSEAYDCALREIYGALPRCSHEGECW